jgi:hypothetical protein
LVAAATHRLVVPGHFRGRRRAHARATGTGFMPIFQDQADWGEQVEASRLVLDSTRLRLNRPGHRRTD